MVFYCFQSGKNCDEKLHCCHGGPHDITSSCESVIYDVIIMHRVHLSNLLSSILTFKIPVLFCLFDLILYVPVNNVSVIPGLNQY